MAFAVPSGRNFSLRSDDNLSVTTIIKSNAILWEDGLVPFKIDRSSFDRHVELIQLIKDAVSKINSFDLHVEFREKAAHDEDYVEFKYFYSNEASGESKLGRIGGKQYIFLAKTAKIGSLLHEMMHSLGFAHEHQRLDRDNYVRVVDESGINFQEKVGIPIGPYDFSSIMHYPCDGNRIIPLKCENIGKYQRSHLSTLDKRAILFIYGPPICSYDIFGNNHYPQEYFQCLTCFGQDTDFGVCVYCKENHHKNHNVRKVPLDPRGKGSFVCDCGLFGHRKRKCTAISTQQEYTKQNFFICYDCFNVPMYQRRTHGKIPVICVACKEKCHQHHTVSPMKNGFAYCDCGTKSCCVKCESGHPNEPATNIEESSKQPLKS